MIQLHHGRKSAGAGKKYVLLFYQPPPDLNLKSQPAQTDLPCIPSL